MIRQAPKDALSFGMGIEFIGLDEASQKRLHSTLRASL